MHMKLAVAIATAALGGGATAQSATTSAGPAASAAVTPGDQNMGRTPENRSGGLMGNDRTATGSATADGRRAPRADRN